MADHTQPDETLNPHARGHQEDRIHVRAIMLFAVGLVAVLCVVFVVIFELTKKFSSIRDERQQQRPELFSLEDPDLYPGPRLQEQPGRDMALMRQEVNRRLDSYGWVDQDEAIAHIPISRAMEILSDRGLPTRSAEAVEESGALE